MKQYLDSNRRQELMLDALADALERASPVRERNNPNTDSRDLPNKAIPVESFVEKMAVQP
ncbi:MULTISPECIES: hypothetical protein [Pseudomonas]|uniref:hypothetical protein n=1 Tax=Pseudomonas TaxID=286 RepID=UPI001BE8B278|nr:MULTISPECIES: hypothetical protein [Pseudomonas]MBT2339490.1 hypothetical protein [Pseudomonas fluorescens]MCD4528654.1 hypothetical protein [Pseudomonas sp. C3-2018]